MPIPTDTFWNVKRLNIAFAVASLLLLAVTGLSIIQDYDQPWRKPQQSGRSWEAALVEDKLTGESSEEKQARLKALDEAISAKSATMKQRQGEIDQLKAQVAQLAAKQSTNEFFFNNLKSEVGVQESALQDARAANNHELARQIETKVAKPREKLANDARELEQIKDQQKEAKDKLTALTADLDALNKQRTKLTSDAEALRKKLNALEPKSLLAKASDQMRAIPLLQFINPRERVQQIVLPDVQTDVAFMKITTIDRCTTCHVNINKKEFAEDRVIAYLEEQLATARHANLPEAPSAKATDPAAISSKPGAVAMPEFWHLYAAQIAPDLLKKPAQLNRIKALAKTVGKGQPVAVKVDGKELESFDYETSKLAPAVREQIVPLVARAWISYSGKSAVTIDVPARSGRPAISAEIKEGLDASKMGPPRVVAMKYAEDLAAAMRLGLPDNALKLLNDQYRRALLANVNEFRRREHLSALDDGREQLAHPKLTLYVDQDSKHPMETIGCTSCHDGSGQETNFVLAAHMPRPIWVDQKTGAPVLPRQLDASKVGAGHHGNDLSDMLAVVYPHDAVVPEVKDLHLALEHREEASGGEAHPATQPTTAPVASRPAPAAPTDYDTALDTTPVPYIDPLSGETRRAVPQMRYWIDKHEPVAPRSFKLVYHEWDWPMRPFKYLQANCVRCHANVYDIKEEAPQVFEGRSLFANMGCANCHQVDQIPAEDVPPNPSDVKLITANGQRKVGTDLRNVNAKLSPAFINSWIWAPKSFRPSTKMPHFFMLENNSSDEEIRRTRQEARAITEYLVRTGTKYKTTKPDGTSVVTPLPPKNLIPQGLGGSADKGKVLFTSLGCLGCHTNLNETTADKRPDGKPMTLAEKWITDDLVKGGDLAAKLDPKADAKALKSEASKLYDSMSYNARQVYITEHLAPTYVGEVRKYPDGSAKPAFQHHGPELSGIGTKLTTDRTPEQAKQWLFDWLNEPRHYSEYTVMPRLRLTPQEAMDLTEYLLAQKRTNDKKDDPWKAQLTAPDTSKLIEMTSLFLRAKYTPATALRQADDSKELTRLATDALTTAVYDVDQAKAEVAQMSRDDMRLVYLGKKLISHYGCMNCHAINGTESMSSPCANLSDWGQKGVDKLDFGYLEHEKLEKLPERTAIPMVNGLSDHATDLLVAKPPATQPVASAGEVSVPPARDAMHLSQKVEATWPHVNHSRTDWITHKLKNTRVYDRGKALLEPNPSKDDFGKPYDKLKMPTFYLNDDEVDAIVTFVLSNRDPLMTQKMVGKAMTEDARRIALGRRLVQKYNCVNCHIVEDNHPTVQQWYKPDVIMTKAPPSLRGEGNKIQHSWLFNFLKNVEPLRPLLYMPDPQAAGPSGGIRMPSFPITDNEATAIAAFFASASNRESRDIEHTLLAVDKYIKDRQTAALKPITAPENPTTMPAGQAPSVVSDLIDHAGALIADKQLDKAFEPLAQAYVIADAFGLKEGAPPKPVTDRLNSAMTELDAGTIPNAIAWPGDDWPNRPEFSVAADWVRQWALKLDQVREINLDPTKNTLIDLAKTWRTMSVKVNFVRELFNAPYPFVDSPRPAISDERFKKGEQMFYEMQCLKCHVLGDPNVAGANKTPTAPNLSLAQRRLQPRWVRHWVQDPDIIQRGTAMPPFFSGLPVWDVHGQSWPRAQKTERSARAIEADYGKTVNDQTALLLDFLYAAGVRGYTGIQPASMKLPDLPPEPPKPPHKRPTASSKPASGAGSVKPQAAPAGGSSIKGKIMLTGTPPAAAIIPMTSECAQKHGAPVPEQTIVASTKGELANVVVSISDNIPPGAAPAEPVVLDQKGCMYEPHVLAMMAGQQLLVKNDDEFLHNVHAMAEKNAAFNFAQPNKDPGKPVEAPKVAETFRVKCDVHPWMSSYIAVFEHPYFSVSKEDGSFEIKGLPPGEYTIKTWHESLGEKEQKVTVTAGKAADVKVEYAAP